MNLQPTQEPINDFQNGAILAQHEYKLLREQGRSQEDIAHIMLSIAKALDANMAKGYLAELNVLVK
jgi:hypothetical protein